jgi:hypothetical protein
MIVGTCKVAYLSVELFSCAAHVSQPAILKKGIIVSSDAALPYAGSDDRQVSLARYIDLPESTSLLDRG